MNTCSRRKTTILNLTPEPITLLAQSGETTTIQASGYVARVEHERHEVAGVSAGPVPLDVPVTLVPIIEETPKELLVDEHVSRLVRTYPFTLGIAHLLCVIPEDAMPLFLVSQAVAEAAAALQHPLASRMVWPIEPVYYEDAYGPQIVRAYKALQRCAT